MTYGERMLEDSLVGWLDNHKSTMMHRAKGNIFLSILRENAASNHWKCARLWRKFVLADNSEHVEAWRNYCTKKGD